MVKTVKSSIFRFVITFISTICLPGATSAEVQKLEGYSADCVGRFQLSLPGPVEIALTKRTSLLSESGANNIAFADGSIASQASFALERKIDISSDISQDGFEKLRRDSQVYAEKLKKDLYSRGKKEIADSIQFYEVGVPEAFAWSSVAGVDIFFKKDDYIYRHNRRGTASVQQAGREAKEIFESMRFRKQNEIPLDTGLCFPYSFLKTDEDSVYTANVVMRLISHPDVQVTFKDMASLEPAQGRVILDQKSNIKFFLERESVEYFTEIRYEWVPGQFSIAGLPGRAAFAKVRRSGEQDDFIFIANVVGAVANSTSKRVLMLYISRNAARANPTPISESKFREISIAIAKSVKPLK